MTFGWFLAAQRPLFCTLLCVCVCDYMCPLLTGILFTREQDGFLMQESTKEGGRNIIVS